MGLKKFKRGLKGIYSSPRGLEEVKKGVKNPKKWSRGV